MKIKPLFDNILLQPLDIKKSDSKIILPNTVQDKPFFASVVACPESTNENPIIVQVNDVVVYNKFAGTEFKLDGKDYILAKQKDILAIIK